jgi:cytochrome b6-f complex iron-sulfur subunit
MSPATIAFIVVGVSVLLWALFMINVTVRRQRKARADSRAHPAAAGTEPVTSPAQSASDKPEVTVQQVPPAQLKPLTPEQMGVSRRQFLNRAWTASFSAFLGFFGMGTLSFLWPKLTGGFGTKITAGDYEDILAKVGPEGGFTPLFIPEGRFYLTYYEGTGDAPVYTAINAVDTKLQALYRKCVHLGCSVPKCDSSKLFECPCHGSKYRMHGEYYGGPAPRGLDRFPIELVDGKVVVDTGSLQEGPPRGTNTWDKFSEPQGPFCVPV